MTQTTAPPTPTPTAEPLHAALNDAEVRTALRNRALCQLRRWLAGAPFARREQEADEILAETYQRAWQARHTYDPARLALSWLHGILTNVLREYARRLGRQPQALPTDSLPSPEASRRFEDEELLALLLDRLTPDERNLIEWCHLDQEEPHQQIAARLHISVGNTRLRLHRAMAHLRRELQKEIGE